MVDTFTNNRNLTLPQVGGDSGTWGTILNNGVMTYLDGILGATQAVTINSADVNLTIDQWNNAAFNLTGTLTGNRNLVLPLNANSATVAVGGYFIVSNQTTGNFQVTVITAASGSTGVTVPQGTTAILYSDTANVVHADNSKLQIIPYAGNPNGNVAGTQAALNKPPSVVWDYTNGIWYVCTTGGNAAAAVWTNIVASAAPAPAFEGYLTPVSNTPVITGDSVAATTVYYTPKDGTWAAIHNGSNIIPYRFSQMLLTLTSSQAANNIYDIFLAFNGGTPVIGTGPSWAAGTGGSINPGSCARGTGTGGTAIQRDTTTGVWVNSASISLIYNTGAGNNTITVAAGQGVLLGSIYIDGTSGQVSCYRSWRQNSKWGISNAYNRVSTTLLGGDSTANWTYSVASTWRPSHNDANNSIYAFNCLPEEQQLCEFMQNSISSVLAVTASIGIGVNWVSGAPGGFIPSGGVGAAKMPLRSYLINPPTLGVTKFTMLEETDFNQSTTFFGTQSNMQMAVSYMV